MQKLLSLDRLDSNSKAKIAPSASYLEHSLVATSYTCFAFIYMSKNPSYQKQMAQNRNDNVVQGTVSRCQLQTRSVIRGLRLLHLITMPTDP